MEILSQREELSLEKATKFKIYGEPNTSNVIKTGRMYRPRYLEKMDTVVNVKAKS